MTNADFIKFIRTKTYANLFYPKEPTLSKSNEDQHYYTLILMRITFISSFAHMTYDYYHRQAKQMSEIKLNQLFSKYPSLKKGLNIYSHYPMMSLYSQSPLGEN